MADPIVVPPETTVDSGRREHHVYALMRPDTGAPFYIGKGNRDRRFQHVRNARERIRRGKGTKKDEAIAFFLDAGLEIPVVLIRDNLTDAEAVEVEVALIAALGRWPDGPLLNKTAGGGGLRLFKHTASAKFKIGNGNRGRKRTPEQLARVSASQRGKRLSEEHKAKVSAGGRGKKRTPQTCANISAALTGKPKSPEHVAKIRAYRHNKDARAAMRRGSAKRKANGLAPKRGPDGRYIRSESDGKQLALELGNGTSSKFIAAVREAARESTGGKL